MNSPLEGGNHCIIVVADLFNKINAQRKLLHRTPIENQAMATRCTLRFNADKQRGVDFSAEKIVIAPNELEMLEKIVNELFGLYFEGELKRLCVKPKTPPKPKTTNLDAFLVHQALQEYTPPESTGLFSWFKGLFGGK